MKQQQYPIDFVVTWLDSSDLEWQTQFAEYKKEETGYMERARFRNLDIFKYWFRAVEQYAPWVNKVFLVTNGTFPKWINPNHPKLVLVKHSDYIPEKYLPTFNSRTIELFMHKIKGLSEHFVYFNDDFYLNSPTKPEMFFRKGLPCDNNEETIFNVPTYDKNDKFSIYISIACNIGVINAHFNRWNTVRQSIRRWYGPHLGIKGLMTSLFIKRHYKFVGFNWHHFEQPYLRSTFEQAWAEEPELLQNSCTRFRADVSLTPYFFRYWQFATNKFFPVKLYKTKCFHLREWQLEEIEKVLNDRKIISICLNDTPKCPENEYEIINSRLQALLEKKFPVKSKYEI